MIKARFGERLRSRSETAQINKALTKILCHNLCVVIQAMYELNVTPEFGVRPLKTRCGFAFWDYTGLVGFAL